MKLTKGKLRNLIIREIRETYRDPTSRHQSELSYSQSWQPGGRRSRKDLQKRYHKANRVKSAREIASQLVDVEEGPINPSTIRTLIPTADTSRWDSLEGEIARINPDKNIEHVRSQRDAYLNSLGWDVAYGDVTLDRDNVESLLSLSNAFADGMDISSPCSIASAEYHLARQFLQKPDKFIRSIF